MTQKEPFERPDDRHREARRVVQRYDWQLISPETLVERGSALMASGAATQFTKALIGAYSTVLYQAFIGERGPEQQRRACEELGQMLRNLLVRNYPTLPPDERTDVTQNTLERIWRARASCREPIAFLSFASYHLLSAVQLTRRQLRRFGESLCPTSPDDDSVVDIPDQSPAPVVHVLNKERRAAIRQFLLDLRQLRPRAKGQIDILALRWLEDLDYPEIAARLKIAPGTAQTRLSRILTTIRSNPDLLQRASDLGLD